MYSVYPSRAARAARGVRTLAVALTAALGLGACAEGESRNAPEDSRAVAEAPPTRTVTNGASMIFAVDRTVSTDTDEPGAHFTATLQSPVYATDGAEAMTAGTESRWIVSESSTEGGQSVLVVRLEALRVSGEWVPVAATVTDATLDTDHPDSDGETAAKIGVGAAAGAIVGQILGGDAESTLAGAGVGAAVGTAVALSTRGGHATLPVGSQIHVRLDESLTIS